MSAEAAADMRKPHSLGLLKQLSFGNIGAVYVWVLIIIVFSIWVPDLFPRRLTVEAIADNFAISGLAALAILLPIASGTFDASVGGTISLSGVICGWLMINTGLPTGVVVLLTLLSGVGVGLFNAFAVVAMRIPPLIATLATWLIADAFSVAVSGNQTITSPRMSGSFSQLAQHQIWGFTIPVLYVLALMLLLGLVLTQTASGRYIYAVGFDPQVARLAGVRVKMISTAALVSAGLIGAFAGVVLASRVASATPNGGDSYLLPAFAAAFLGATQFRAKRFNAAGTIIAVFMLGTGQYGLLLAGAPQWTPNVFQGLALVAAIGLTQIRDPNHAVVRRWRAARNKSRVADVDSSETPESLADDAVST